MLALKEHEMDRLASVMGHDLRIHREFYRMPLDVLQVARVSKVFFACEEGRINEFAGKCLSDINLDSNEVVYLEDSDDDSEDGKRDEGNFSVLTLLKRLPCQTGKETEPMNHVAQCRRRKEAHTTK